MATNLHNLTIGAPDDGFAQLLHVDGGLTGDLKALLDGDATDSALSNDGTVYGALVTNKGKFKQAYDFDGSGTVDMPDFATLAKDYFPG